VALEGPIVNALAIVAGVILGLVAGARLGEEFRDLALRAMGLVVMVIGFKMVWPLQAPANLLISLVAGAWLGDRWHVEGGLERLGAWAERRLSRGNFSRGFVPATLIFNVGALAILGSIQAGLGRTPTLLLTKSVLDGVTGMVLTVTLGWGVIGAAVVTLVYEGAVALLAHAAAAALPAAVLQAFSAEGGVLIAALGANFVLGRPVVRVGNLLPALALAVVLAWVGRIVPGAGL
jgi:uncharacterized membrane protein YqgA involved in biofilm formation